MKKFKPRGGEQFFSMADLYLSLLKEAGQYNTYTADKPRVKHFRDLISRNDISFPEITIGLLERFKVYLKSELNIGERTIMNHLVVIRSVFSLALKEGLTEEKYYPFGKGKISIKFPETTKKGLTREDIEALENVTGLRANHEHARNLWLLSYYFAGMRISDILRLHWSDFQDWRLHYTMGKNHKAGSLKTHEKAIRILEKYEHLKTSHDDLIFSDLRGIRDLKDEFAVKRQIAFSTSRYDKFLRLFVAPAAKIEGKLTMHIARHTFATLAGDKIPIQMLQKLYRHSDIKTTIGYQANFIRRDADDALDNVLNG